MNKQYWRLNIFCHGAKVGDLLFNTRADVDELVSALLVLNGDKWHLEIDQFDDGIRNVEMTFRI